MTEYHSIHSLLDLCKEQEKQVWEVVQQADMEESGATEKQVFEKMRFMYKAMQQADKDYEADLKSQSGMVGGDGERCVSLMPVERICVVSILVLQWKKH